jgi:hypothetical protein
MITFCRGIVPYLDTTRRWRGTRRRPLNFRNF